MAIKYLAGERLIGTAAERAALSTTFAPKTSWKQLAKTTLGVGGANVITVSGIAQKDNLWVLVSTLGQNASLYINYGINNGSASTDTDDSGKWSWAGRYGGAGTESTDTESVKLKINDTQNGYGVFGSLRIKNRSASQKFTVSKLGEYNSTTGIPKNQDFVGKFNRFESSGDCYIDRIELTSQAATGDGSITFPAGSEVVVLGCDDDEADSGTPFWEELTDFELTTAGAIDTGASSIAEKKYLLIEIFQDSSGTIDASITFNNDDGARYMYSHKAGSTSFTSSDDQNQLKGFGSNQGGDKQGSAIFANISGQPKIGIFTASQMSGAGSAGPRQRGIWKYSPSDLTDFISRMEISGTSGIGSTVRIWGGTP